VHRGDKSRRRTRVKQTVLALSFFGATAFVLGNRKPAATEAEAAPVSGKGSFSINLHSKESLASSLDSTRGELELTRTALERATKVIDFSSRYEIGADLASKIVDAAQAEGIDPDLAFRLVKLESDFKTRATSPVGAVGLTQLMPSTARYYEKNITREKLYDPTTNLRVGFRYLRGLVTEYGGNVKLALVVYNRGPVAVAKARADGDNPSNGYDRIVTKGYHGRGIVE
jgi:soluble lytic murein transglycosylase-like protein